MSASLVHDANQSVLAQGDLDAVDRYFAEDFVVHLTGQELRGREGVRRYVRQLHRAFSEIAVEVEVLAESPGRIAWQRTVRALHRASFQGFPASGAPLVWREMVVSRVEDDRFVEDWSISDLAEQLLRARKQGRAKG